MATHYGMAEIHGLEIYGLNQPTDNKSTVEKQKPFPATCRVANY